MNMADRTEAKRSYEWSDRYLSDFLDTTTINGIIHVFRGRSNIRRVIWGIIFIGSIISCIVSCGLEVATFVGRPTATTTTDFIRRAIPFPAVTICNLNIRMNTSEEDSDRIYRLLNFLFNPDVGFMLTPLSDRSINRLCRRTLANMTEFDQQTEIRNSLSDIGNFVHYCGFRSNPNSSDDLISCGTDEFQLTLTSAGPCYTFNSVHSKNVREAAAGLEYGLKLVLNVGEEPYPSFGGLAGIKVVVHDRDDIAQQNFYGISVSPGQNVDIGVHRRIDIHKADPNCIKNRHLEFFPSYQYSRFACRENSLIRHVAGNDSCGCVLSEEKPISGPHVNTPNCTFSNICCLIREYDSFDEYDTCPLSCIGESYQYENSYSSFPSGRTLMELATSLNVSVATARRSFLSVRVFIDDIHELVSVTDFTYSAVNLLSNIGGLMGLFLGISIISIFEVLILILDEVKKRTYTKRCRQQIDQLDKNIPLPEIVSLDNESDIEETPPTENLQINEASPKNDLSAAIDGSV